MNKVEKYFMKVFEIEPEIEGCYHICNKDLHCKDCDKSTKIYPQITDRILLELICVLALNPISILFESMLSGIKEVELLKNSILFTCIANKDGIKYQVQKIFKENK